MNHIDPSPPKATHPKPPIEVVFFRPFTLEILPMNEIVESLVVRLNPQLREAYEERAAIMQFDAKLSRDYAEALALLDLIRQNPAAVLACWQ